MAKKLLITVILFVLLLLIIVMSFGFCNGNILVQKSFAHNSKSNSFGLISLTIEEDLDRQTDNQLGSIDFSSFENELNKLGDDEKQIFENDSFLEKVKKLIKGETKLDFSSVFKAIMSFVSKDLLAIVPLICLIIGIGVLSSIVSNTSFSKDDSIKNIVHFLCFGTLVLVVFFAIKEVINLTQSSLSSLKNQMEIGFPILLTMMASVGSVVSVGVYQPLVAILSGSLMTIFNNFILPLFLICLIFTVAGNLTDNLKLNKFSKMFNSFFKWTIGLVFTLFTAFLTVQGITANSYDGLSIRTTKYAMKSYIPFVGSYLADGLNMILTSSVLIKNSVGVAGLLLLFSTVISPILKILLLKFGLLLASSVLEPLCDKKMSNFLEKVSNCLSMLIATICCASFAYLITIGLIMCTGNLL